MIALLTFMVKLLAPLVVYWKLIFLFPQRRSRYASSLCALPISLIAHRGSREEGHPENTLIAFREACRAGAHVIELDVWLSKDGQVVVHHDETFERMSNGACATKVVDTLYADCPKICPTGKQKHKCVDMSKRQEWEKIPLLQEVLDELPLDVSVIIEFKQDSVELIAKVQEQIQQTMEKKKHSKGGNSNSRIFWFSLIEVVNKKLRVADESIPTITSISQMLKTLALYYSGLLPFFDLPDGVFGITVEKVSLEKIRNEKALLGVSDLVKRLLAVFMQGQPPYAMLAPNLFYHLRRRGIPVWFLGVNEEETLRVAAQSGATAVLTDKPDAMSRLIKQRNIAFLSPTHYH